MPPTMKYLDWGFRGWGGIEGLEIRALGAFFT